MPRFGSFSVSKPMTLSSIANFSAAESDKVRCQIALTTYSYFTNRERKITRERERERMLREREREREREKLENVHEEGNSTAYIFIPTRAIAAM